MGNPLRIQRVPNLVDDAVRGFPRLRAALDQISSVLTSLLSRDQVTRTIVGGVESWSVAVSLAPAGGLQYNGSGQLTIKLAATATSILNLTTSGLGFGNQSGNKVLASPLAGANGPPTFRILTANDIPGLSGIYQPLDGDLTAISALSGTSTIYYRSAANTWSPVTIGANLSFNLGVLNATLGTGNITLGNGTVSQSNSTFVVQAGNNVAVVQSGNTITVSATSGGGGGNVVVVGGLDPNSSIYPPFTPAGNDDEFNDGTFSGWTAVNSGNHLPTLTETNNVLSILHPGSDAAAELHAWMKTTTINIGSYVEVAFNGVGVNQQFNLFGVMFSDGTDYGNGSHSQVTFYLSPAEGNFAFSPWTGYSTQGSGIGFPLANTTPTSTIFMRLYKTAANTWRGCASCDGVSFVDITGDQSSTLSPTQAGFFVSTYGGVKAFQWSVRYVRFG